ncbi:ABC transporter permease subunit [Oceanirhabdus seepicola]|uniref:ABC transporter permease subunit n=1 Tax=Oceanirhabdus seepicola TaxID=2828781 RepID=A0A9J6P1U9_9CLOT|nr:ABC transporter permease subunit [Oceanirhabdus seepicola]MCM1989861.1 ABC transporter permease subunit [Oceanirhabdus seepicola]
MNIVLRELKANRKALIIWCISMFLFISMGMIKYSGFSKMGSEVNKMMESLPKVMTSMFGINSIDLTSVGGYYSMFFIYFALIAGIHAIMLGATIISKEERDKTADFLMVKPIKRHKAVTSKLIAALINILILNIVTFIGSVVNVAYYNKGESITGEIFKITCTLLILQIVFLSLGLLFSSLTKTTKKATGLSTGVILAMYMLSLAIPLTDKLEFLGFITPFYYFDAKDIMLGHGIELIYVLISLIIVVFVTSLTYVFFNKKDIHN